MVVEIIQLKSCHGRSPDEGVFIVIQCEWGIAVKIYRILLHLSIYIHYIFIQILVGKVGYSLDVDMIVTLYHEAASVS